MYAITGVTGRIGGDVARRLLAAGKSVRAIVRDRKKAEPWAALGCEIATADLRDARALTAAFQGATAVFILPPPVFDPGPGYLEAKAVAGAVAAALRAARPGKAVELSTVGADAVQDNLLSQHTIIEAALRDLPVPLTVLRPAWFVDNAAWDVAPARKTGVIQSFLTPLDRKIPMVAAKDVAATVAKLIQEDWSGRRVVELEGPDRVSPNDLAEAFANTLGKPVRTESVPHNTWEALFRSQGMKNPIPRIRMLDGFNEGWLDFPDSGENAIKGPTSAEDVIAELILGRQGEG